MFVLFPYLPWGQQIIRVGLILMEFSDADTFPDSRAFYSDKFLQNDFYQENDYYNFLFSQNSFFSTPDGDSVFGSVRDYWESVSYGKVTIVPGGTNAQDWFCNRRDINNRVLPYRLPQTKLFYNSQSSNIIDIGLDSARIAGFQVDNIGLYNILIVMYAGEQAGGALHPQAFLGCGKGKFQVSEQFHYVTGTSIQGFPIYQFPETFGSFGSLNHEFGHAAFGLDDLYGTGAVPGPSGIGVHDLMARGNVFTWQPNHPSAYSKNYVNPSCTQWASPDTIRENFSNMEIAPFSLTGDVKYIPIRFSEYFLLENRQATDFDANIPVGLAIFHAQDFPAPVFPNSEIVDLEEADGLNRLDQNMFQFWGTTEDIVFPGNTNNTKFSDFSNPDSRKRNENISHIAVKNIREVGTSIFVDVILNYWADTIKTNTTWSDSIFVGGDIVVPAGVTLTIMPGTKVIVDTTDETPTGGTFDNKIEIQVNGTLIAKGFPNAVIGFRSFKANPTFSEWKGIVVFQGGEVNLEYCEIRDASTAVDASASNNVTVQHSIIHNCIIGVNNTLSKVTVAFNRFHHINNAGIFSLHAENPPLVDFSRSVIYGNVFYNMRDGFGRAIAEETFPVVGIPLDKENRSMVINNTMYNVKVGFEAISTMVIMRNNIIENSSVIGSRGIHINDVTMLQKGFIRIEGDVLKTSDPNAINFLDQIHPFFPVDFFGTSLTLEGDFADGAFFFTTTELKNKIINAVIFSLIDTINGLFIVDSVGPANNYAVYKDSLSGKQVISDGQAPFDCGAYVGIDTTLPPPIVLLGNTTGSITVKWFHNRFLSVVSYNIFRSSGSFLSFVLLGTVPAPTDSFLDTTANAPGAYHYIITAIDSNGRESEPSREIVVKIPIPKTVTFGETGTSTYNDLTFDTHLRQVQPTRNYGVVDNIRVKNLTNDEWKGLLKFDFRPGLLREGVRDTAEITSALITLKLTQSEDTQNRNLFIYQVNKDWGEGTKNNVDAINGEATWNSARLGVQNWSTAGANHVPNDREGIADDTVVVVNTVGSTITIDVTRSVKQMFSSNQNYGWLLVLDPNSQMRYFRSKEGTMSSDRPKLTVNLALDPVQLNTTILTFGNQGQETYTGVTTDAHMREISYAQNRNYGGVDKVEVIGPNSTAFEWKGLVRLDFIPGLISSGVLNSSEIQSATLKLRLALTQDSVLRQISFFRLLKDWGEGNKNNTDASTGEMTWSHAKFNQTAWGTGGANNTTTNADRVSAADLIQAVGNTVGRVYEFDVTGTVKSMFTSNQNYGWIMALEPEAKLHSFNSKEVTTANMRPQLVIKTLTPVGTAVTPWFSSNWNHRQKIIIPNSKVFGTVNHLDFTVLITESNIDLHFWSNVNSSGSDVLVTSGDGVSKLKRELVRFDAVNKKMELWVKVPVLSVTSPTSLYLYYKNSAGSEVNETLTWDNNYISVYHEQSSFSDSKGNNTLTNSGASNVGAKISSGFSFDGVDDYASKTNAIITGITAVALECWMKTSQTSLEQYLLSQRKAGSGGTNGQWILGMNGQSSDGSIYFATNFDGNGDGSYSWSGNQYTNTGFYDGSFHYVGVQVQSNGNFKIYVDGNLEKSYTASEGVNIANLDVFMGKDGRDNNKHFTGTIDEVRISNSARSSDYFKTSFNNQSVPATFYSVGSVETFGSAKRRKQEQNPVFNLPLIFALEQNRPNPFNPVTEIHYAIPVEGVRDLTELYGLETKEQDVVLRKPMFVNLEVYNLMGQRVRQLVYGSKPPGYYQVVWDGRNELGEVLGTGVYVYKIEARSTTGTTKYIRARKMLMIK